MTTVTQTAVDFGPLLPYVWTIVGGVAVAWVRNHVKDKQAADVLSAAIQNGVNAGHNWTDGAEKDGKLSVDLGSKVAAQALRYVGSVASDETKRLGLSDVALAERIWARVDNVDGKVPDNIHEQIVAIASNKPAPIALPSDPRDLARLADELYDLVGRFRNQSSAAPLPPDPAPALSGDNRFPAKPTTTTGAQS